MQNMPRLPSSLWEGGPPSPRGRTPSWDQGTAHFHHFHNFINRQYITYIIGQFNSPCPSIKYVHVISFTHLIRKACVQRTQQVFFLKRDCFSSDSICNKKIDDDLIRQNFSTKGPNLRQIVLRLPVAKSDI